MPEPPDIMAPPPGRVSRRLVLAASAMPAALAAGKGTARASPSRAPDVVVFCDPTLRPAIRALGRRFEHQTGAPVLAISAPSRLMQAQLARGERDDVLVTLLTTVSASEAKGLVTPRPELGIFRTGIVIATAAPGADLAVPDGLRAQLDAGQLGAPDRTENATFDTPAVLQGMGIDAATAGRFVGEIDTTGVSALIGTGRTRFGLVLETDARAHGLAIALRVPDTLHPPITFAIAVNRREMSRNTASFIALIGSDQGRAVLAGAGLERMA